jgi:hypothetical protein
VEPAGDGVGVGWVVPTNRGVFGYSPSEDPVEIGFVDVLKSGGRV